MLILLGLSYYVRGRIGPARWRKLHRFTALAWVLGVVHAVGEGTDAGAAWFLLTAAAVVAARRRAAGGPALGAPRRRRRPRDDRRAGVADAFACFGGTCCAIVAATRGAGAADAVALARRRLLAWHDRFTRFEPGSELSRLNADPRAERAGERDAWRCSLEAIRSAARATGGLVDGTLVARARRGRLRARPRRAPLPLPLALRLAPRAPARRRRDPRARAGARSRVDRADGVVRRPPGVALDSGGLAKGLFADLLADELARARELRGRLRRRPAPRRRGGAARPVARRRPVRRRDAAHVRLAAGGVATSGIGAAQLARRPRAPRPPPARPRHRRGPPSPAIVQATALAPTALEAEVRAKAALLSGPGRRGAAGCRTAACSCSTTAAHHVIPAG